MPGSKTRCRSCAGTSCSPRPWPGTRSASSCTAASTRGDRTRRSSSGSQRRASGIQGVKIWPPAGARPNEPYCYRVYERCAELDLPVVVHTGQEIGPLRSECTLPILVDQPANDFPELTFVLAHAGMGWWQEAAEIAWHHPNVYLDIAYWQAKYLRSPERFCEELRALISTAGKDRVLFGTDWPALRQVGRVAHGTWVKALRDLPEGAPGGIKFERDEIDLLLGGAAEAALGL